MYINIYGCGRVPGHQYTNTSYGIHTDFPCQHGIGSTRGAFGAVAAMFFILVVFIVGFVLISLFIGVIAEEMTETVDELQQQASMKKQKLKIEREARVRKLIRGSSKVLSKDASSTKRCLSRGNLILRHWFYWNQYHHSRNSMLQNRFVDKSGELVWVGKIPAQLAKDEDSLRKLLGQHAGLRRAEIHHLPITVRHKDDEVIEGNMRPQYKSWCLATLPSKMHSQHYLWLMWSYLVNVMDITKIVPQSKIYRIPS